MRPSAHCLRRQKIFVADTCGYLAQDSGGEKSVGIRDIWKWLRKSSYLTWVFCGYIVQPIRTF